MQGRTENLNYIKTKNLLIKTSIENEMWVTDGRRYLQNIYFKKGKKKKNREGTWAASLQRWTSTWTLNIYKLFNFTRPTIVNVGRDGEFSYTTYENVNSHNHFGNEFTNIEHTCTLTLQFSLWVYIQQKWIYMKAKNNVEECS